MKQFFKYIHAIRLYALKYYLILKYYPKISIEGKFYLDKRCQFKLGKGSKLIIKGNLSLMGDVLIQARDNAVISMGKNCAMNRFTTLIAHKGITLGDGVMLGENVKIYDNDHAIEGNKVMRRDFSIEPVFIGDGCWIANNAVVLKGSSMGPNTVVGALSLVSGTLDADAIYMGVPCRRIKKLEPKETTE
jgi:acetyltransferase-like isoleucine patch superfamily enzyme